MSYVVHFIPIVVFILLFVGSGVYFSILGTPNAFYQLSPVTAAIVVSEIMDKLSPNIAPPTTVATDKAGKKSACTLSPAAIGAIVAIVPIDVPIAVDIKADTRNIPINRNSDGIRESAILTVASTLPIWLVTLLKAPASKNIIHIVIISL